MTKEALQKTVEQIDVQLDKILKAAGSGLSHYSMQYTVENMREALRDATEALAQTEQEPVAWRWRSGGPLKSWILSDDKTEAECVSILGNSIEPLYTKETQ